jgi:hypothetical protein
VPPVAAEKRLASAPAAAGHDFVAPLACHICKVSFHDKVRAILNQLAIHSEDGLQCVLALLHGVVFGLELAHRRFDQFAQNRNFVGNCRTYPERGRGTGLSGLNFVVHIGRNCTRMNIRQGVGALAPTFKPWKNGASAPEELTQ